MSICSSIAVKPQITVEDWFRNNRRYSTEYEELSGLAFNIRQKSNELRDLSTIETSLNQQITKELLSDRAKEIADFRDVIHDCLENARNELQHLKYEKECCSKELQNLNPRFTIVNECNTLRSSRKKPDMCSDSVESELNNEYHLLERMKKELSDKCEEAWSHCIKLTELIGALQIDIAQKDEAVKIEKKTIELANDAAHISRKPEINRPINYSSYESWLENCKFLQSQTITELGKCVQLREEMCQLRQKAYCKISGQFDATNFALRKRVFEIHYVLDELMWQKQTLQQEEESLMNEIEKLKEKLHDEKEALKLFESQNKNRIYRVNSELCQEKCTDNLEVQVVNAKQRVERLENQLDSVKKTYSLLDQQIEALEVEIRAKTSAVTIDRRCLELRNELIASNF